MKSHEIIEHATHPAFAVPATTTGAIAHFLIAVPDIVQITTLIYLVLLISHKVWQMYVEWRDDPTAWCKRKKPKSDDQMPRG